jgi:hypothetical protein
VFRPVAAPLTTRHFAEWAQRVKNTHHIGAPKSPFIDCGHRSGMARVVIILAIPIGRYSQNLSRPSHSLPIFRNSLYGHALPRPGRRRGRLGAMAWSLAAQRGTGVERAFEGFGAHEDRLRVSLPLGVIFVEVGTKSPSALLAPCHTRVQRALPPRKSVSCNARDSRARCGG